MKKYPVGKGDILKLQLDPQNRIFRWSYEDPPGIWLDLGCGGIFIDGVVDRIYSEAHCFVIKYYNIKNELLHGVFPLEEHKSFREDFHNMYGYPRPVRAPLPRCDCGSNPKIGDTTHYDWCSRKQYTLKNRIFDY